MKQPNQTRKTQSELSINEFRSRLENLTTPEKIFFFVTPYKFNGKTFCGSFTNEQFNLTLNSHWQHIKMISIKGKYYPTKSNKTDVDYQIGRKNWKRNLLIAFFIIMLFLNTLPSIFDFDSDTSAYLSINLFFGAVLFGIFLLKAFSRFVVEQKFKSEFRIDIKPTNLNGYGGETST